MALSELVNIGLSSFREYSSFIYESSISRVDADAFSRNEKISHVSIPNAEEIEDNTFEGCILLQDIVLPNIDYTSKSLFGSTTQDKSSVSSLTSVTIVEGDRTKDIGTMLADLPSLAKVVLPTGMSAIAGNAFANTSLTRLKFSPSIHLCADCLASMPLLLDVQLDLANCASNIGLSSCPMLLNVVATGAPEDGQLLSTFYGTTASSIKFGNNGASIFGLSDRSFEGNSNLLLIDFSKSLITCVPASCFNDCTSLSAAYFSSSLSCLQKDSFLNCLAMNARGFDLSNVVHIELIGNFYPFNAYNIGRGQGTYLMLEIGSNAFLNLMLLNGPGGQQALTASISASAIGEQAFIGCLLTSITLYSSVDIPTGCFKESLLIEATIKSSSLEVVGELAFEDCFSLAKVCLPSTLTAIGSSAFNNCHDLVAIECGQSGESDVVFSSSLLSIGQNAFYSTGLRSVAFNSSSSIVIDDGAFALTAQLTSLHLDSIPNMASLPSKNVGWSNVRLVLIEAALESMGSDYAVPDWHDTLRINEVYSKLLAVFFYTGDGLPTGNASDVVFKFSDAVVRKDGLISDFTCLKYSDSTAKTNLTSITIDSDIDLFLLTAAFPPALTSVAEGAFDNVRVLKNSQFKTLDANQALVIGNGVLSGMASLSSLTADFLLSASSAVLKDCSSLVDASMLEVSSIATSAFCGCSRLEGVATTSKLSTIGTYAFYGMACQEMPVCMENVISIGAGAFASCTSLKQFNAGRIDSPLTSIGINALSGDISLTSAIIPSNVLALQDGVFAKCSSLSVVDVHRRHDASAFAIGLSVFSDCPSSLSVSFKRLSKLKLLSFCSIPQTALTAESLKIGSPLPGVLFYTADNECHHPLAIAIENAKVYFVQDPALVVDLSLVLLSVDPAYETARSFSSNCFDGLEQIRSSAFNSTSRVEEVHLPWTFNTACSKIEDGTFSASNARSITQLYIDDSISSIDYGSWNAFFTSKLGGNTSIRVFFNGGWAQGGEIYNENDPFAYRVVEGVDTIVGVHDELVPSTGAIDSIASCHAAVSANAFSNTHAIKEMNTFGYVSCIQDNAFMYNSSITSIVLSTSASSLHVGANAFANSNIKRATVDMSSINGSSQISGYGLNDTVSLESIEYTDRVSVIAPSAMANCRSNLTSVTLPQSLLSIGEYAFAEMLPDAVPFLGAVNFNLCPSLLTIGSFAFYNSISTLANDTLSIHSNLTSIGDAAFAYSRRTWTQELSAITLIGAALIGGGASLVDIGASAFMYNHLRDVELPEQLSSIGAFAFAYPKYKFPIHIRSGIKKIGEDAFKGNVILNPQRVLSNIALVDVSLDAISSIMGVEVAPDRTAPNRAGFTDATVISATVGGSPYTSFAYVLDNKMNFCPANLSIDIIARTVVSADTSSVEAYVPAYLSCISSQAFKDCTSIASISAPSPLSIGTSAFYNCYSLSAVHPLDGSSSDPYMLSTAVGDCTFYNCLSIGGIHLLSTVLAIGASAFYNCKAIESLYDLSTIDMKQWWQMSAIGDCAFYRCSSLTSFDIPQSLSTLGKNTFKDCTSLLSLNIDFNAQDFANKFGNGIISSTIADKFGSIDANADTRVNFLDVTYMNNGIVKIDNEFIVSADYEKLGLRRIALEKVRWNEFDAAKQQYLNLSAISRVNLFAFAGSEKLRSISFLPNRDQGNCYELEEIGDYAFSNCTRLMSVNGGALHCLKIGTYAFNNCQMLLSLRLDYRELTDGCIGHGAFYGTSLNSLEIFNCPIDTGSSTLAAEVLAKVLAAFRYEPTRDLNPLELPEQCIVTFVDTNGMTIGKYDSMLHDLMHASIDINRNALTFVDKTSSSIRPLLLVKPMQNRLPAIAANTFHANIVGRWK